MITLSQFEEMLKKEWISYFPESYQNGKVFFYEKHMRNGATTMKVSIQGVTDKAPMLPLDSYYECIMQGEFTGNVLKRMADDFQIYEKQGAELFQKIVDMHPQNFEIMKNKITFVLVNRNASEKFLEDAAYLPLEDLAKVFYIQISSEMHAKVTKEMCREWGVDTQELEKAALENMPCLLPAQLSDMGGLFFNRESHNYLDETGEMNGDLYVLTNKNKTLGAATMLYPGVMEKITEKMKAPFYIIPSSVHEIIIVPKTLNMTLSEIRQMVRLVNKEAVSQEEFLSNNVYCYDSKTREIRMMHEDFAVEKPKRREREYER